MRRPDPLVPPRELAAYRAFVRAAFDARAPLRRLLPPRTARRVALEIGAAPAARPWDLDARQWAAVFRAVRSLR